VDELHETLIKALLTARDGVVLSTVQPLSFHVSASVVMVRKPAVFRYV